MSIVIERPLEEVFAYVTDPANISEWAPYVHDVWHEPPGPLGVGTKIWQTVRGREFFWEVTAYESNELCRYTADYFYFSGEVTYRVEPFGSGTKFSVHDRGGRKGLMKLLEPLLNRIDSNARKEQLNTIKGILEGGHPLQG